MWRCGYAGDPPCGTGVYSALEERVFSESSGSCRFGIFSADPAVESFLHVRPSGAGGEKRGKHTLPADQSPSAAGFLRYDGCVHVQKMGRSVSWFSGDNSLCQNKSVSLGFDRVYCLGGGAVFWNVVGVVPGADCTDARIAGLDSGNGGCIFLSACRCIVCCFWFSAISDPYVGCMLHASAD